MKVDAAGRIGANDLLWPVMRASRHGPARFISPFISRSFHHQPQPPFALPCPPFTEGH
jgi:hypothetical protein